MKKFAILLPVIMCVVLGSSCRHNNQVVSFKFKESEHTYSMNARFNKNQARRVDKYMDNKIGKMSNMSFVNSQIDGKLTLDDHTTFYLKKYAGTVEIKLDKDENSVESYQQVKSMCEGIKNLVVGNKD